MKKLTKYDVADLVLVFVAIRFLFTLVAVIASMSVSFWQKDDYYTCRTASIAARLVYPLLLFGINYILFFKRSALIRMIFPHSEEIEVNLTDGLTILTQYSFWIRVLGIITLLRAGVDLFSDLATALVATTVGYSSWMPLSTKLVSVILAFWVLWKADWIAEKVQRIGSAGRSPTQPD